MRSNVQIKFKPSQYNFIAFVFNIQYSLMLSDDRPIQPSKQYIQESQNRYRQQSKRNKDYLQRGQSAVLPCQRQKPVLQKDKRPTQQQKGMSKAQQYEAIKQKNRKIFGERNKSKKENRLQNNEGVGKKIDPKKMTVDYKPKNIHIETEQKRIMVKPEGKQSKSGTVENQKLEYEKMVAFMKKMYSQFEREKAQFEKQKQYLIFKKTVSFEEGINFEHPKINPVKKPSAKQPKKAETEVLHHKARAAWGANGAKNQVLEAAHQQLANMPQIQNFHYTLENLHECQPFNLHEINKYFPKEQLLPENNALYRQARMVADGNRSKRGLVKTIRPECTHGTIGVNHAVCTKSQCAEKRITKFENNWYEVWVGGRYRTIYNEQKGYKAVWYHNGDIKQEFKKGNIIVYLSKAKKVIEVKIKEKLPFWYFPYIGQLQTKDAKGNTEVIYSDGRHEIIMNEQEI